MQNNKPHIIYFFKVLAVFIAVYWLLMPLLNGVAYGFDGGVLASIQQHIVRTPVGFMAVFIGLAAFITYRRMNRNKDDS